MVNLRTITVNNIIKSWNLLCPHDLIVLELLTKALL